MNKTRKVPVHAKEPAPKHNFSYRILFVLVNLCCLFKKTNAQSAVVAGRSVASSPLSNYTRQRFMVSRVHIENGEFWMAHHDVSDTSLNGAEWYRQAWEKQVFGGTDLYETVLSGLGSCRGRQPGLFVQAGAHLGIFGFLAASLGCQALLLEGSANHIQMMRTTAALNGWAQMHPTSSDRVHVERAIVSNRAQPVYFVGDVLAFSLGEATREKALRNKEIEEGSSARLDDLIPGAKEKTENPPIFHSLLRRHKKRHKSPWTVELLVVDVEGHEQEALLGAKELIEGRKVRVFEVEVWLINHNNASAAPKATGSYPGLDLLVENGYHLWSHEDRWKPYDHRRTPITDFIREKGTSTWGGMTRCIWEIFAFATLEDVKRLRWM